MPDKQVCVGGSADNDVNVTTTTILQNYEIRPASTVGLTERKRLKLLREYRDLWKERYKAIHESIERGWPGETTLELSRISGARIDAWAYKNLPHVRIAQRRAKAFDETMDYYSIARSRDRYRFTIGDIADEFRRNRQPARSCRLARILDGDFVADVYLAAKKALSGIPALHRVFRLVWLEGRDDPDNVPKEVFTAIQQRVGRVLLERRIWPTGVYFTPKGL